MSASQRAGYVVVCDDYFVCIGEMSWSKHYVSFVSGAASKVSSEPQLGQRGDIHPDTFFRSPVAAAAGATQHTNTLNRARPPSSVSSIEGRPVIRNGSDCESEPSEPPLELRQRGHMFLVHRSLGVSIDRAAACNWDTQQRARSWWAGALRIAVAARWQNAFALGLRRPIGLDSFCSGMGSEFNAAKQIGLPPSSRCTASEVRFELRELLASNYAANLCHCWDSMRSQTSGTGGCQLRSVVQHNPNICTQHNVVRPGPRRDVMGVTCPCQPFSFLSSSNRQK